MSLFNRTFRARPALALIALAFLLMGVGFVGAQPTVVVPSAHQLVGVQHIYQGWNNCGPAALTMALTYFGVPADQYPAALWLKPNSEDKNVSPWQLLTYVNTQLGSSVRALLRQGGNLPLLKLLIANNFPVLVEAGYDPPQDNQGWMGHYLPVTGYDDAQGVFFTQDSFNGANYTYDYAYFDEYWRHFNRLYIVLYDESRELELMGLLGGDADEQQNVVNALSIAVNEATTNPQDTFAWFNIGTNYTALGMYDRAAVAYDQARNVGEGLPWRMLWYQFGMYEAYYQVGRYDDVIALARAKLDDGGGQYVEETFYYGGLARAGLGETERAISNFNGALAFNPNFSPAREALAQFGGA
ncbi:MAG: C39 family peptidase [Chloroflexota bacterium]|nr:C39 family peptidase [Chloroflexota bacterium]